MDGHALPFDRSPTYAFIHDRSTFRHDGPVLPYDELVEGVTADDVIRLRQSKVYKERRSKVHPPIH
jgi:hypothetical protein